MTLSSGEHLGPYEILDPLGAGGMGEVYRARDTRLERTVAIKVLPAHLAANPELRQRLEREARAVSALNHPHICTLHDIGHQDGTDFLVMEYLEGETLAARLAKGPLPIDQVLRYAIEMAEALAAAHREGVFHRDLKPGNVMLTRTGSKLLDFGLAKLREPAGAAGGLSALPTQAMDLTQKGTILGTVQYMAPEQLEGKETDARSDLFAFGAVLYEMATGRKAFEGKSQASVITAIMSSAPPPVSTLQPAAPPALDRVIQKCLAKDPDERWHSAADLASELKWMQAAPEAAAAPVEDKRGRLPYILAIAVSLLAALALAVVHLRETPPKAPVVRFLVSPPEKMSFRSFDVPVLSPDGERVVFGAVPASGPVMLWVRPLASVAAQSLPGTASALFPFWSPDGRQIAFFSRGKLLKVDLAGGPAQTLCDAQGAEGGTWNRDGVIVFSRGSSPLYRVSASGGDPKPVTSLDSTRQETLHTWPFFLPDGRHFLYTAVSSTPENRALYVGALDSKDRKQLLRIEGNAAYVGALSGPGYLVFNRGETLLAQPFDARRLELRGEAVPIAERVTEMGFGLTGSAFSVSETGALAYLSSGGVQHMQMVWLDRNGKRLSSLGEPGDYSNPALSPDDKRLAVGRRDPQTRARDVWIYDLIRGTSSRLTFDPADDLNPAWSPDGNHIAFSSERKGQRNLYQKLASGTGDDEALFEAPEGRKSVEDWSRDGRVLVFNSTHPANRNAVWTMPLAGDRKPAQLFRGPFATDQARLSPNGRWIAYRSTESGRPEIYVQSFPPSGGKWQISTAGGTEPQWRRDGKELLYMANMQMMAVDVKSDAPAFEAGIPKVLFETRTVPTPLRNRYVATGDAQRFLVITPLEEASSTPFTVVLNWPASLKR